MARGFTGSPPFPPLAGDFLEAVLGLMLPFFGLTLAGFGFSLALHHGINAIGQLFANCEVTFARLSEIHYRILTQRHQFLFAVGPIAPTP